MVETGEFSWGQSSSVELVESDEESGAQSSSSSATTSSLLKRLRCPKSSELSHKRKVDCNPPRGKKSSRGQGVNDPKSVTPHHV